MVLIGKCIFIWEGPGKVTRIGEEPREEGVVGTSTTFIHVCMYEGKVSSGRVGEQTRGNEMDRFTMLISAKIVHMFIGPTREEMWTIINLI